MGQSESSQYYHEIKAVLTVDIVNFSARPVGDMLDLISQLLEVLHASIPPGREEALVWSPAGDGGSLTFDDVLDAHHVAIKIATLVHEANSAAQEKPTLAVRIGLHAGTVVQAMDFDDRTNIWGDGINYSSRIVDLAKPGQILASQQYCEASGLINSSQEPTKPGIKSIGTRWVKHGISLDLYNINDGVAGISIEHDDSWYDSFQAPFTDALKRYESMLANEKDHHGKRNVQALRLAALSKRLIELDPDHNLAKNTLSEISLSKLEADSVAFHYFLSSLPAQAIEYFLGRAEFIQWKKGDVVFAEGDDATFLIVIVSGEVEVRIEGSDYQGKFTEGELVGEMGLFRPAHSRQATVTVMHDMTCLRVDYEHLAHSHLASNGGYATLDTELRYRRRIVAEIWRKIYARRSIENTLNTHPIFRDLSEIEKQDLLDQSLVFPEKFEDFYMLDANWVWEHLSIVVQGGVSIQARFGMDQFNISFHQEDCISLSKLFLDRCPYDTFHPYDDTHMILVPWDAIEFILEENGTFRQHCEAYFEYRERERWHGAV